MTIFSSLYLTRLHRELGTDDTQNLFTVTRRKAAINEAQGEFADLTECLVREVIFSGVGGTGEYDLNSTSIMPDQDFTRFSKDGVEVTYTDASSNVTILAGDDLPRRDIDWLNRYKAGWRLSTTASTVMVLPELYYLRPDGGSLFLGFTPPPSIGSSASVTVRVSYQAQPSPLTADTSEPFTVNGTVRSDLQIYHQGLVHYAAAQLEKLRRDDQQSQTQMQRFLGYIARYATNMRIKGGRVISQTVSYYNRERHR